MQLVTKNVIIHAHKLAQRKRSTLNQLSPYLQWLLNRFTKLSFPAPSLFSLAHILHGADVGEMLRRHV